MTAFTDSGTIASKLSLTYTEISQFVDPVRATSRTKVSALDTGPITDFATVLTLTELTYIEAYVAPAGFWGSADVDDGVI